MAFSPDVAEKALLDCGRKCCLCHKFCGPKMELHHIRAVADGGEDTYENCIPLCLDCHAEVRAYDPRHPKGRRYTESELRGHRDSWYATVRDSGAVTVNPRHLELDRELFREIREVLPSAGSIMFVREHGYEQPFREGRHDELREFVRRCKRPEFEFLDADLESLRVRLLESIRKFFIRLGVLVCVDDKASQVRDEMWLGVPKRFDGRPSWNPNFAKETLELNDLSLEVCEAYDDLIRLGRRKLGV